MALEGYYDVRDYGAVGDGVADDTNAVKAAETACETAAAPGGVVYFPPGTYLVSSTISIAISGVQWLGTGAGSSKIKSKGGAIAPTVVSVASTAEFIIINELEFDGNNAHPTGLPIAPSAILFNGGSDHKVLSCFFQGNTGPTIQFTGVTDAEVAHCRFYEVGYNDGIHATSSYRTDAVLADLASDAVRVHHNNLDTCYFGGIYIAGARCDVSHNSIGGPYSSGIYVKGSSTTSDTRIALNSVVGAQAINGADTAGIQIDGASEVSIIGNMVSTSAGNGIEIINGWNGATLIGNTCWDNGGTTSAGDSGIRVTAASANTNNSLILIGNLCFDDRTTSATQAYGVHILSSGGSQSSYAAIIGNSFYGNTTQGIIDSNAVMTDDSNTIIGNSQWLERQHSSAPFSTTTNSLVTPQAVLISAGSMRERCGVRITSAGTTTGTLAKVFQLGFGVTSQLTNMFNFTIPNGTAAGNWQITAVVMNDNSSTGSQAYSALFYLNNTVYKTFEGTLSQDTTTDRYVNFSLQGNSASDFITLSFFTVERC